MMMTSYKGAELIMALMLSHAAPAQGPTPVDQPAVEAQQKPMMIAAGESSAGGPAEAIEGAFRDLPGSEKARARNLLEAQHISPGGGPAWSLDKIAAARKNGKSWERIVITLQRERLLAAGDPEDFLDGTGQEPTAIAGNELLTGGMATASGPDDARTITTGLSSEISCGIPAGGTALTAAVPEDGK